MTRSALSLGLISFASLACASVSGVEAQRPYPDSRATGRPPMVSVWMAGSSVFRQGERRPVHFRVDRDAYVTIARLDTDGRVTVLYPESPHVQRPLRGGRTYTIHSSNTFRVNDRTGLGYVFAIASYEPFDYSQIARGRRWDYMHVRHARYDPFEAMYDLAEMIVWDRRTRYSLDYAEYHVGRVVSYPRYMCIDAYGGDPYNGCRRFALVYRTSPYLYGYGPYYGYPDRAVLIREPQRYGRIERLPPRGTGSVQQPPGEIDRRRREGVDRRDVPADPRRPNVTEAESRAGGGTGGVIAAPRRAPENEPRTDARDERQVPRVIRPEPRQATPQQSETRSSEQQGDRGDPRAAPRREPDARPAPVRQAQPRQEPRAQPEQREPEQRSSGQRTEERRDERSSDAQNSGDRRRRSPD